MVGKECNGIFFFIYIKTLHVYVERHITFILNISQLPLYFPFGGAMYTRYVRKMLIIQSTNF